MVGPGRRIPNEISPTIAEAKLLFRTSCAQLPLLFHHHFLVSHLLVKLIDDLDCFLESCQAFFEHRESVCHQWELTFGSNTLGCSSWQCLPSLRRGLALCPSQESPWLLDTSWSWGMLSLSHLSWKRQELPRLAQSPKQLILVFLARTVSMTSTLSVSPLHLQD